MEIDLALLSFLMAPIQEGPVKSFLSEHYVYTSEIYDGLGRAAVMFRFTTERPSERIKYGLIQVTDNGASITTA